MIYKTSYLLYRFIKLVFCNELKRIAVMGRLAGSLVEHATLGLKVVSLSPTLGRDNLKIYIVVMVILLVRKWHFLGCLGGSVAPGT